jgi:transcriptional regulator with XRE-family HTH domain
MFAIPMKTTKNTYHYKAHYARILTGKRHKLGLTLRDVASLTGLSKGMIDHIEKKTRALSYNTLLKLCNAYNMPQSEILAETTNAPRQIWEIVKDFEYQAELSANIIMSCQLKIREKYPNFAPMVTLEQMIDYILNNK